ncbi:MAG TPA: butyrate kinase [Syntrophales bacterium]|nr:butyrate kinase [Syntrophales bacterium]
MEKTRHVLAVNVGSTSTKVAFYRDAERLVQESLTYSSAELAGYKDLKDQLPLREAGLRAFIEKNGIDMSHVDLVISRGGLGRPAPAGAYAIDQQMCDDLMQGKYGKHPSALGPSMALGLSRQYRMPAVVIDPPSTDEFQPLARVSGLPEIERKSAFHALNQKAAARKSARQMGKRYEEVNLVVAHLGGGITIGAHCRGQVIDCTHGLTEGPFSPERAGALPTQDLLDLAHSGRLDPKELSKRLVGQGGLAAYLGTTNAVDVESAVKKGDAKAEMIYRAMAYQIAKDIGAMAAVLAGKVDGVVLTGGLAHSEMLTAWVRQQVQFIAPVWVFPGEDEMEAMAEGALRILRGEEAPKPYRL